MASPRKAYPEVRIHVHPSLADAYHEHVRGWKGTEISAFIAPGVKAVAHNRPPGQQLPACQRCPLCKTRKNVVLYRGHLPCDVLFIGEAPGVIEDSNGYPFTGPAGVLLDDLRGEAWSTAFMQGYTEIGRIPTWGITNIVACIPRQPPEVEYSEELGREVQLSSGAIRPPTKAEAAACAPRLHEIIKLANPKLIVTLGQEAKRYLPSGDPHPKIKNGIWVSKDPAPQATVINLLHPAAILRIGEERESDQTLAEKRFVLTLSDALRSL